MATLNFPTNPTSGQQYSFEGKTWYWTGQAWRLTTQGAINDIPIGNITPSTGDFTNLSADTLDVSGNTNIGGNLSVTGTTLLDDLSLTGNIQGNIDIQGGTLRADNVFIDNELSVSGNVTTQAYVYGNARYMTGFVASGGSSIDFGNTHVAIPDNNEPVTFEVDGNANVLVVESNQIVANVDISTTGNVVAQNFVGNITGNLTIGGANAGVVFNDSGTATAASGFSFDPAANIVSVTGNVTATGNVQGSYILGNGSALTSVLADRGGDAANWNAMTQMGVYTVNRDSWAGTSGTPLDSQVFVGLLEIKNSTGTALEQIFYPGTVEDGNVKIAWNRTYWGGSWSAWYKIVNDDQVVSGGSF